MRKLCKISMCVAMVLILCTTSICVSAKTMYSPDGKTINVADKEVKNWKAVGWYEQPVVTIYTTKGKSAVVGLNELKTYESLGWYDGRMRVCIYNSKGEIASVPQWQLKSYLNLGWNKTDMTYNKSTVSEVNVDSFCKSLFGYWSSDVQTIDGNKKIQAINAYGRELQFGLSSDFWVQPISVVKKVLLNSDGSYDVLMYSEYTKTASVVNMKYSDTNPKILTVKGIYPEKVKYTYHTCCYNTFSAHCDALMK